MSLIPATHDNTKAHHVSLPPLVQGAGKDTDLSGVSVVGTYGIVAMAVVQDTEVCICVHVGVLLHMDVYKIHNCTYMYTRTCTYL